MNEFLDFYEKSLKAENADNCCPMKTASEYLGVSPFPENTTMYDVETGYKNGTVFSDLNKPFLGGRCI